MKRFLYSIVLAALTLSLQAQTQQDAATVYSEFSRNSSIVKTANPTSPEYQAAVQRMLQLYPQLQSHAAWFQQHNQPTNALTFAKAYVDMAMMPQFADMHLEKSEPYATMTYFVGSNYWKKQDFANTAIYLQRYIDLGAAKYRSAVFWFLAQSQDKLGDIDAELATLDAGLVEFPTDNNLLIQSINLRMEKGWYEEALLYIDRALSVKRNDAKLLSSKGQCLEGLQRYEEAANIFSLLAEQTKSLKNYKHYAINLYNCGVQYRDFDKNTSFDYFQRAIPVLKQVVGNDPTSVQFTNALGIAYLVTNQYDLLEQTNARLRTLGAPEVTANSITQTQLLVSDLPRSTSKPAAITKQAPTVQNTPTPQTTPAAQTTPKSTGFRAFAQTYVEKEIQVWQQKDPFETIDEYKARVTEQARNKKVEELMKAAKKEYLSRNSKKVRISDFKLEPYDAENRVFLITSAYGDIVLPVPRENNEARNFASTWKDVHVENAEFDIAGDDMVIRTIDFVTRTGNVYHYSDANDARYSQADIAMQFDKIDYSNLGGSGSRKQVQVEKSAVKVGSSDVDINIPITKSVKSHTFAFLIGNENYQQIAKVPFALHDVRIMKEYCNKTLGILETNIRVYEDATYGKMLACIRDIKSIADAYNGDIDIIFYYAGHGVPDEASKSAYLLPVDADATQTETCYAVSRLYHELGQLGAKSVIVFMDACFSGSQRGEGMLASARGVALKARPDTPQGKMVTFSAATGDETAFPYEEQQHGMFTYYLLKGLQENKGKISLGELADYVQTQVKQRSVVINKKSQTPTVSASPEAVDWRKWSWK